MLSGNNIGPLHDKHGRLTNRSKVEAEMFNAVLAFVFNTDDELWDPPSPELDNHDNQGPNLGWV